MNYTDFLNSKLITTKETGIKNIPALNSKLYDFQKDITAWALKRGSSAIFADCGMGKTPIQLEWAHHIPGKVLILAPLAVADQTVREGKKFGIELLHSRNGDIGDSKIIITNYEMMEKFDESDFNGIVLDESSILKSYDGKFRTRIIEKFKETKFKLALTATPAPNDYMELGNHSEFLGIMTRQEMLSMFFVHDGGDTAKWRIKGHAESEYWKWLASWAVMIKKPSDLGYEDGNFILPKLNINQVAIESTKKMEGMLFALEAQTLQERISARRETIVDRCASCADLVNQSKDQWIICCNLNGESQLLKNMIKDSVQIIGSDTAEFKAKSMLEFSEGKIRVLITKPSISGFGMNWQNCHKMAFVGLSDSYEEYYQAVRRCWRFGQKKAVDVYLITSNLEGAVVSNIRRKEADAERMALNMVEHMKDLSKKNIKGLKREDSNYMTDTVKEKDYTLYLGDSVELIKKIESDSVHYSIFSPPFSSLYTYSNSERDMGNCKNDTEFMTHFKFLIKDLYRVLMPGRLISFHCMNLPISKQNAGYIGIRDFRGELIKLFQDEGFIYHSEVCIWKDPVTAMQRTKALGLLHKQIKKDSCMSRQGIPDYLVTMRKRGDNPERVTHTNESFPVQLWQQYASPVWMDINPNDTLQFRSARENNDERHICPLQLQVIEKALNLWTNPGDTILSPFAGIGSEGHVSLKNGRKFIGIELKKSYFDCAVRNLAAIKREMLSDMFETVTA